MRLDLEKTLVLALAASLAASVASAGTPDPRNCIVEPRIVAGTSQALGSPGGIGTNSGGSSTINAVPGFEVEVRDITNAPLAGKEVTLSFAATGIRLLDPGPGTVPPHSYDPDGAGPLGRITVDCAANTLTATTSNGPNPPAGKVIFSCRFGGFINTNAIEVVTEGVLLASVSATSTDIDNAGPVATVNSADLNLFRIQLFAPQPASPATDYNGDTITNSADLNLFRVDLFSGASGSYCVI